MLNAVQINKDRMGSCNAKFGSLELNADRKTRDALHRQLKLRATRAVGPCFVIPPVRSTSQVLLYGQVRIIKLA